MIIIGVVLAFFAIFADGGFTEEAFHDQSQSCYVIDEME